MKYTLTTILAVLMFTACNKTTSVAPAIPKNQSLKNSSTSVWNVGDSVHNLLLDTYFDQYGVQPDSLVDAAEYATICENMTTIADSLFGTGNFRQSVYENFDSRDDFNLLIAGQTDEWKQVLIAVHNFNGPGDIVEYAKTLFADTTNREVLAYLNVLKASQVSARKRGYPGPQQQPQIPRKSHEEKVAEWDAAAFQAELKRQNAKGTDFTTALIRAGENGAFFSALRDCKLRAIGQ